MSTHTDTFRSGPTILVPYGLTKWIVCTRQIGVWHSWTPLAFSFRHGGAGRPEAWIWKWVGEDLAFLIVPLTLINPVAGVQCRDTSHPGEVFCPHPLASWPQAASSVENRRAEDSGSQSAFLADHWQLWQGPSGGRNKGGELERGQSLSVDPVSFSTVI